MPFRKVRFASGFFSQTPLGRLESPPFLCWMFGFLHTFMLGCNGIPWSQRIFLDCVITRSQEYGIVQHVGSFLLFLHLTILVFVFLWCKTVKLLHTESLQWCFAPTCMSTRLSLETALSAGLVERGGRTTGPGASESRITIRVCCRVEGLARWAQKSNPLT